MESIRDDQLDGLTEKLNAILKTAPEKRRELHTKLGAILHAEVEAQIMEAGFRDGGGKIGQWQETYIGSGGGYAAVRPEATSTGADSPGAVTNYNEGGHKIRKPSGKAKRYRSEVHVAYVEGKQFYAAARRNVEGRAIQEAEKFVDEFAEELEK